MTARVEQTFNRETGATELAIIGLLTEVQDEIYNYKINPNIETEKSHFMGPFSFGGGIYVALGVIRYHNRTNIPTSLFAVKP